MRKTFSEDMFTNEKKTTIILYVPCFSNEWADWKKSTVRDKHAHIIPTEQHFSMTFRQIIIHIAMNNKIKTKRTQSNSVYKAKQIIEITDQQQQHNSW